MSCGCSNYTSQCTSDYLLKQNYLSEFLTQEEKQKVKDNLGIDKEVVSWENIVGDINNNGDIYQLKKNLAAQIDALNSKIEGDVTKQLTALKESLTASFQELNDTAIKKETSATEEPIATSQIQYRRQLKADQTISTLKEALDALLPSEALAIEGSITLYNGSGVLNSAEKGSSVTKMVLKAESTNYTPTKITITYGAKTYSKNQGFSTSSKEYTETINFSENTQFMNKYTATIEVKATVDGKEQTKTQSLSSISPSDPKAIFILSTKESSLDNITETQTVYYNNGVYISGSLQKYYIYILSTNSLSTKNDLSMTAGPTTTSSWAKKLQNTCTYSKYRGVTYTYYIFETSANINTVSGGKLS